MSEQSVKVTLIKSVFGQLASIRGSVKGLGLRRIGHSVWVTDTPSNRGMMNAASHMLRIEEHAGAAAAGGKAAGTAGAGTMATGTAGTGTASGGTASKHQGE